MNKKRKKINQSGFSLVEMMVATAIFAVFMGVVMMTMSAGQSSWTDSATAMNLQQNIRASLERISKELRESGSDAMGNMKVSVTFGAGVGGSDIIKFSMPVVCEVGGSIMDANGDVTKWGAPLTWGCSSPSCMDGDNNCLTTEYSSVQYYIDADNQLIRAVTSPANTVVRTDIFAHNISNLKAVFSMDSNIINLTITAFDTTAMNRSYTVVENINVYLRNRG